jgi:hypothetical protein
MSFTNPTVPGPSSSSNPYGHLNGHHTHAPGHSSHHPTANGTYSQGATSAHSQSHGHGHAHGHSHSHSYGPLPSLLSQNQGQPHRPRHLPQFQRADIHAIKQELHDVLGENGLPYWKALNGYLLGQIGREEMMSLVGGWLKGKNGEYCH